ncbi:protocadherin Fat 4-like [Ptychodera flava]|uniref:protocadherin Fat 4-like n=1 Tax=Ptychodera flava TaxID=63121 RepID=UPI00396A3A78
MYLSEQLTDETEAMITVQVVVYNPTAYVGGESAINDTATVKIMVEGHCNLEDPIFNQTSYSFDVLEDESDGTVVGTVRAHDPDTGSVITAYDIIYGADDKFSISQDGAIRKIGDIDRETLDTYTLIVNGVDKGYAPRTSVTEVVITVLDVNDNDPEFAKDSYSGNITENSDAGQYIVIVPEIQVTDADIGSNADIYLRLTGDGSADFNITIEDDGFARVVVTGSLDSETLQRYDLEIEASNDSDDFENATVVPLEITLLDLNDNEPTFDPHEPFEVVEIEPVGYLIGAVSAFDLDVDERNNKVQYYFIDGDYGKFDIDRDTGNITVADTLYGNITGRYSYNITVMAYNSGYDREHESYNYVIIEVGDYYNVPPQFPQPAYRDEVYENATIGSYVTTVKAYDYNSGTNGELVYEISSDEGVPFAIDNNGTIIVDGELDRETKDHYIFEVVATDEGVPPMSASVQVRIDILDVNDNPPVFCPDSYTTATIDGTMPEISVLKVLATDADEGSNAEIRYSLRGDGHEYFKVDECTGLVQIQQKIDSELMYEEGILEPLNITNMTAYRMVIESVATDLGHPPLSGYANVTIIIYDSIYDYPQFNETTYLDDVRENEEAGTFVTRVHATVNTPDIEVFYGILDPSEVFQIDRVTGDITTLIPLDRESRDVYDVTVRAEANIPPVYPATYTTVTVIVTDVNDNAPGFNASSYAFSVFENATKWTFLGRVAATDLDLEENAEIGYYIIGGDEGDQFYINDTTGELFVHDDLDREETASYSLVVMAEDMGLEMTLNSSVVVDITLLDVNDNPPSFDDTFYQGELSENDPPGTSITTLSAEDPDIGINAVVLYKVNNNGDCDDCFYVEEYSGVLRNTKVLEDMTGSYDVEVEAYNLNDISLNDKTVVNTTVTVAPTVIATSPLLATTLFSGTSPATPISETGSTPATDLPPVSEITPFIGTVTDGTPGGPGTSVQPETGSPPTGTQPVSGTRSETGSPPTGGQPGTGSPATGVSPVSPVTPGVPTHTPIATLTPTSFTTPPVDRLLFEYNEYKETIVYNHTVGSEVVTVTATYNGEELEDTFYEIIKEEYTENMNATSVETDHFKVDNNTGNITLSKALDENLIGLYTLSVDAYNETNPTDPLQHDSTTVLIRVVGFDNEAPYFDPKSYQGSVTDIDPEGTLIVTVTAFDPDYPTYGTGEITYEIADTWALGYFEIGETSGEITRGSIPFCGLQDVVTFDVRAVDGGIPPLYDTANVTVDIEYIENIHAPSVESDETDIPENIQIGTLVIKVVATDDDDGDAGEIDRYGIKYEGGNTKDGENKFTINVNTGEIHTSDDFDYDEKEERYYQIIVYAVDKGVPEKTGYGTIEVYITDVNDNLPEFVSVEDTFSVKEAQNAGEFVGKVHATDIDSGVNALITYTIEDGDDAGHFNINNETGRIYTSTVLEYMENPYQLTLGAANIYAEMNSDLKQMKNVVVHVVDINNNAPEFTNAPYEENIRMDVDIGYSVLTVQASDDDVGYNGDVAYALDVCDDDGCSTEALMYFAIDRTTGVLTVAAQFTPQEGIAIQNYQFKVIAFDNGSPRLESDSIIKITVQDQDFDQPIFKDQYDSVEMLEEQNPRDTCGLLPGVDYDDFGQVSYFFTGGDCDYVDRFELVKRADSYEICNAKILDREEISSYRFIITAFANRAEVPPCEGTSDFTGLSSNQLGLLVNISDLNEHPYFDDQIFYFKGIDDTTPFGVSVFQVSAIDNDEGDNAVLCYTDDGEHFDVRCNSGDIYTIKPNYVGKARSADIFNVTATDGGVEPLSNSTEVKMYILAVEDYCILESRLPRTEIASNLDQILGELGMLHDYIFMFDSTLVNDSQSNNLEAMTDMWFYVTDISAYEVIECEEFLSDHSNLPATKGIGAQQFDTTPEKFVDDWEVVDLVPISYRAHVYKRASSTPAYAIYLLVLAIVIFIVALILVIYLMVEDKVSQKKLLEQKEFLERMASFRKQPVRFAESTGETSDDRTVLDVGTDMDDEPLLRTPNVKYIPRTVVYEEQELSMDVFQEPSEHGDDWSYGDTLNALEEIQPVAIDNPGFMDDYGQYIKLEPDEVTTEDTQGRHHDLNPAPNPVAVLSEPQPESEQPLRSTAGDTPVSAAAEDHKNEDSKPSRILPNQYNPLVPLPPLPPPPQTKEPSVTSENESEDKSEPTPEKDEPPFPPPPPLVYSPQTQDEVAEPEADIPQPPVQASETPSFEKYHQPTTTSHPPPLPPIPPPPPPVIRQDDVTSLQSERSDTPSSVVVRDTDLVIISTLDDAVPGEGGHRPIWPIMTDDFPPPPSQDDATSLQSGQSDTPSSVIVRDTDQVVFSTLDELSDADSEEASSTVKAFTNPMYGRMFDNNDDGGEGEEIEMNGFTNGDQFDAAGDNLYNDDGEDGGASRPTRKRMDDTVCAEDEILEKRRVVTFNDEVEEHYDERFPDEPEDVFTTF